MVNTRVFPAAWIAPVEGEAINPHVVEGMAEMLRAVVGMTVNGRVISQSYIDVLHEAYDENVENDAAVDERDVADGDEDGEDAPQRGEIQPPPSAYEAMQYVRAALSINDQFDPDATRHSSKIDAISSIVALMLGGGAVPGYSQLHGRNITESEVAEEMRAFTSSPTTGGRNIIIFASSVPMLYTLYHVISRNLAGTSTEISLMSASTNTRTRAQMCDAFGSGGNAKVMIIPTGVGSVGLNLQAASAVIFADASYERVKVEQAECRAHRRGQNRDVRVFHFNPKASNVSRAGLPPPVEGSTAPEDQYTMNTIESIMLDKIVERGTTYAEEMYDKLAGVRELPCNANVRNDILTSVIESVNLIQPDALPAGPSRRPQQPMPAAEQQARAAEAPQAAPANARPLTLMELLARANAPATTEAPRAIPANARPMTAMELLARANAPAAAPPTTRSRPSPDAEVAQRATRRRTDN